MTRAKAKTKRLNADERGALALVAQHLVTATHDIVRGVGALGIGASTLIHLADVASDLLRRREWTLSLCDPGTQAMAALRATVVAVRAEVTILARSAPPNATRAGEAWRELIEAMQDACDEFDAALVSASGVVAHIREGISKAAVAGECIDAMADVQDRVSRVHAGVRIYLSPVAGVAARTPTLN